MYQDQTRWQTRFWFLFACAEVDVMKTSLVSPLIANMFLKFFPQGSQCVRSCVTNITVNGPLQVIYGKKCQLKTIQNFFYFILRKENYSRKVY